MLWKFCTQYASEFGKLSSDHRTGKGQFSFQSQSWNQDCQDNLRYADDTTFMAESKELKSLLMKAKEESKKSWLIAQHSENEDRHLVPSLLGNRWGNNGNSELYLGGLQNHCRWWLLPWNWKTLAPWKKSHDQPRQHIKKQRHYFADNGPSKSRLWFFQWSCMDVKVGL